MQDRPTAQELVEAVASFLETEILPTLTDPRLRFRGLIAANVLGIVARELADGRSSLPKERLQLAKLLGNDLTDIPDRDADLLSGVALLSREFCLRVRSGVFDSTVAFDAALVFAEATVVEKLRINNPRYLARPVSQ